jgi:hypothetical protein
MKNSGIATRPIICNDCLAMSLLKTIILMFSSLWFISVNVQGETATNSNAGQIFRFKFELNKPLIYAIQIKQKTINDVSGGNRSSLTKNSLEMHYKIKLTALGKNQDGTTTVHFEPFDFEQNAESTGTSGQSTTTFRGLDIVAKQNDIVIIDTAKGVGVSQAKNLKVGAYPVMLSGNFTFDPAGNVKTMDGDLPFIDHWQENLNFNPGFFQFIFPTNVVAVADSWNNCVVMKNVAGTILNGDGITETNIFTRELDDTTKDSSVACFRLYMSALHQNLGGYIEQSGQRTSTVISDFSDNMNATFRFDQKLGRLIELKKTDKALNTASMVSQGNTVTGHTDAEIELSMRLISP